MSKFLFFCSATIYPPFPIPPLPPPPPHPPPHQHQHHYNPRQPDPVELGEEHRFTSGGEIGLRLEGGDPDHRPGSPARGRRNAHPTIARASQPPCRRWYAHRAGCGGAERPERWRNAGSIPMAGRLVSIRGSKRLPWVSILRIIHYL